MPSPSSEHDQELILAALAVNEGLITPGQLKDAFRSPAHPRKNPSSIASSPPSPSRKANAIASATSPRT